MSKNKKKPRKNKKKDSNQFNYYPDIIGVVMLVLGLFYILSLFNINMGLVGSLINKLSFSLMGFGAYIFPFLLVIIGLSFVVKKLTDKNKKIILASSLIFLSLLIILDSANPIYLGFIDRIKNSISLSRLAKGGGIIGSLFGFILYSLFGTIGTYIVLSVLILINLLLLTNINLNELKSLFENGFYKIKAKREDKKNDKVKKDNKKTISKASIKEIITAPKSSKDDIKILDYRVTDLKEDTEKDIDIEEEINTNNSVSAISEYQAPSLDLLNSPVVDEDDEDDKEIRKNARLIKETMKNFNIDAKVIQINKGPTITCYELEPAPGIRLSKIVSLSDNISLSLASSDIRIEAPIPGKAAVGIEVPNKIKKNVLLKELLLSDKYKNIDSKIPLALGKDVSGEVIVSSIDKMPHLLIAGATGSGKSVCINTIIMNIIYKSSPEDVKLLLIDPKVVELNIYNGIPHLLIPVVTDAKKSSFALNWAVEEMESRYKIFAENNVRDIHSYNKKFKDDKENKLPMIVIIIDELADLMMVAAQEIEDYICRLAQMARAAGMYLIVATQRPSVDVITGTIKANIPSRISFAVSSQVDSRTILDMGGAEKLLGKGDMLFYPSFYSKPSRLQGAFISDSEVEAVVNSLKNQYQSEYDEDIIEVVQNKKEMDLDDSDELLADAISLIVEEGQASISFLQRKLKIGYARAARIVDQMEERNIVGGFEGSKPRKVLITKENLEDMYKED